MLVLMCFFGSLLNWAPGSWPGSIRVTAGIRVSLSWFNTFLRCSRPVEGFGMGVEDRQRLVLGF